MTDHCRRQWDALNEGNPQYGIPMSGGLPSEHVDTGAGRTTAYFRRTPEMRGKSQYERTVLGNSTHECGHDSPGVGQGGCVCVCVCVCVCEHE